MEDVVVSGASELHRAYAGKRVLVTGHTGFKGSWLTLWLRELGAEVTGFALADVASTCRSELGDVRDAARVASLVREVAPDFVFHLAAQALVRPSYEAPVDTIATNVMGTAHVLDAVRRAGQPTTVVIVTTDKCYENREWVHGYREEDPMGGHDPYSMSKGAAELVTASYRRSYFPPNKLAEHGVAVASARAGNVIGGGDWAKDRLVPDIAAALAAGRPIPVRNPSSVRPWQHVLEPLYGYLLLGAKMRAKPEVHCSAYNFGPGLTASATVREMVEAFIAAWGTGAWEDRSDPNALHEAHLLRLSIDKAHAELGFTPRWDAKAAIAATVAFYRAHARGANGAELRALALAQIADYSALPPR